MAFTPLTLSNTVAAIRACTVCEPQLPLGANPILQASPEARIVLVSQAPGRIAHEKSIAYQDPSGRRLREWLGVSEDEFYNSGRFVIMPMGFCYPGKKGSGDAPPRPECAPLWHQQFWSVLPSITCTLLIGSYAQKAYLGKRRLKTLTATVQNYEAYLPQFLPIPHPSPLNNRWLRNNPWFEAEVVVRLREVVRGAF